MFENLRMLRQGSWQYLLLAASLSLLAPGAQAEERRPPALSPELARAYLDNAGSKLDAEDFDAARPVLQLLLYADGVPPEVVSKAAQWLADIDGSSALPATAQKPPATDVARTQGKRRVVTIRSTAVPSVEISEPDTPRQAEPEVDLETVRLATPPTAPERPAAGPDPQPVAEQLEHTLDGFHSRSGRYPTGYRELNELLPPGTQPLDQFDIVYYVARYGGYILTIRNRAIRESEMTIQKTGLIQ